MMPHKHFQSQHANYTSDLSLNTNNLAKSDRRQWNKSNMDLNLEYPDPEPTNVINNEYKKRYDDYLLNLQINNQIMKLAAKKDKNEEKLEKLEGGFCTYVNGAHKTAEKYTPRYTTASKSSSLAANSANNNLFTFRPRLHVRKDPIENLRELELIMNKKNEKSSNKSSQNSGATTTRKKWTNESFTIKTSDGYEIKINAPNSRRIDKVAPKVVTKPATSKQSSSNRKAAKKANKKESEYYSDDFVSDSDSSSIDEEIEQNDSMSSSTSIDSINKSLIQNVKFSDCSASDSQTDDEEEDDVCKDMENKDKKKFFIKLSSKDVKLLRQSINELNLSVIKDHKDKSNQMVESCDDFDATSFLGKNANIEPLAPNTSSTPSQSIDCSDFSSASTSATSPLPKLISVDHNPNKPPSSIYDLIVSKASGLNLKERSNLLKFLSSADKDDEDEDDEDAKLSDNKFLKKESKLKKN